MSTMSRLERALYVAAAKFPPPLSSQPSWANVSGSDVLIPTSEHWETRDVEIAAAVHFLGGRPLSTNLTPREASIAHSVLSAVDVVVVPVSWYLDSQFRVSLKREVAWVMSELGLYSAVREALQR